MKPMPSSPLPRIVLLDELAASPWRNGGGVTRELARSEESFEQPYAWRVSIADIDRAGPFSCFDGYHRQLVLLEGTGLRLQPPAMPPADLDTPGDALAFDGAIPFQAALHAGACRVVNIMTAHDAPLCWSVSVLQGRPLDLRGECTLIPLQGRWRIDTARGAAVAAAGEAALWLAAPALAGADAAPHARAACEEGGRAILLHLHFRHRSFQNHPEP